MDQFTIKGKVICDTEINGQPISNNSLNGMSAAEDWQALTDAQDDSIDSIKNNNALMKEFGNIMPEILRNFRAMNDIVARTNQNLPALGSVKSSASGGHNVNGSNLLEKNLLQVTNTGGSMLSSVASGNFSGAVITGINGVSSTTNNLSQAANSSGMEDLASILGKASIAAAIVGAAVGVGKKFSDAYQGAMPTIFGTGKAFGTTDNDLSMMLYKASNDYNNGTGLDNSEFNSLIVNLRKQGVGNGLSSKIDQARLAGSIAETSAKWAYATGGDSSQFSNFAGLMSRYGGSTNVAEDFNYVMSAGLASGLNEGQLPEFLSSIQKVMEDGIAKGFSRSATDVANTMLMFSKLSGNDAFWQGEQGASILNSMNSGISGATGLSKTTDILAYRAFAQLYPDEASKKAALNGVPYVEGGSYVNTMMLMEQGLNAENFGALLGNVYSTTNDKDSQIERIRQMFGLNYTGASRVRALYEEYKNKEYDENFELQLKNIQEAPENLNNETKWQESVNKIQEMMQDTGEGIFKGVLDVVKNTAYIAQLIGGDEVPVEDATVSNDLWGLTAGDGNYNGIEIYKKELGEQRAYLNGDLGPQEYRDYIMGLVGGDEAEYNEFLNSIFSPETKEQKKMADRLARTIETETVTQGQGTSFKELRDRADTDDNSVKYYIKALYELFKDGIEVN